MFKDRTLAPGSDGEIGRRILALACRSTSFRLLEAAEAGPLTRADAATANGSTAESADLIVRELRRADLLRPGPRIGRFVTYEITPLGERTLEVVRRFGEALPAPDRGWWITLRRGTRPGRPEMRTLAAESRVSRVYRCVGDFDFVLALAGEATGSEVVDELVESLRRAGARDVAAARAELSA